MVFTFFYVSFCVREIYFLFVCLLSLILFFILHFHQRFPSYVFLILALTTALFLILLPHYFLSLYLTFPSFAYLSFPYSIFIFFCFPSIPSFHILCFFLSDSLFRFLIFPHFSQYLLFCALFPSFILFRLLFFLLLIPLSFFFPFLIPYPPCPLFSRFF